MVGAFVMVLAGCGGTHDFASQRSTVEAVAGIIDRYNASRPYDLGQMALACRRAHDELANSDALSTFASPSAAKRTQAHALAEAVRFAVAGYHDCTRAASADDFATMIQADRDIEAANAWISLAARSRN